jgi:protoporphyrinogen oxidase
MDLIVGAGVTGLSYANFCGHTDYMIIERENQIGGYCKTIKQDGFTWDYSGHFFHFRNPDIEKYLLSKMGNQKVLKLVKKSQIKYGHLFIDYPFQKNIHQLNKQDFIDCLYDLFFKNNNEEFSTFKEMLYSEFGKSICDKFLIPYNEKVFACDLDDLDKDAMGRFLPYANLEEIISNFKKPNNKSYNSTFIYPEGGAIEFANALYSGIDSSKVYLREPLRKINVHTKEATTDKRTIKYDRVISSIPFNQLMDIIGLEYNRDIYGFSKVLVSNLGFDKKGNPMNHWVYFPEKKYCFYRVGYYDNIFNSGQMSLYVEIGFPADGPVNPSDCLPRVLADLRKAGIVTDQNLRSYHTIVMSPAYIHINKAVTTDVYGKKDYLGKHDISSIGRYGSWTYCSIEDNIIEAKELAEQLN